jgi:hypothetical protein
MMRGRAKTILWRRCNGFKPYVQRSQLQICLSQPLGQTLLFHTRQNRAAQPGRTRLQSGNPGRQSLFGLARINLTGSGLRQKRINRHQSGILRCTAIKGRKLRASGGQQQGKGAKAGKGASVHGVNSCTSNGFRASGVCL